PSFGSRNAPHNPRALTWSRRCSRATFHSSGGISPSTGSSGMISLSMNERIQSRCSWNSGSASKSHAMPSSPCVVVDLDADLADVLVGLVDAHGFVHVPPRHAV